MAPCCQGSCSSRRVYKGYVLVLCMLAFILNQLDRFLLGVTTRPMAQSIGYGDLACFKNKSLPSDATLHAACNGTSEASCLSEVGPNNISLCEWNYNGQGIEYELLAGPVFTIVFTVTGIPLGLLADVTNRKNCLAVAVFFWSAVTGLTGFVQQYWQLATLRFLLGVGEAGCNPFAASLIASYFGVESRGAALGLYNWGIYIGYSLSFAVGNLISAGDGEGWRWAWFVSAIPGLILGPLIFLTVREPEREDEKPADESVNKSKEESTEHDSLIVSTQLVLTWRQKAALVFRMFLKPSLILICLGGSIRNAGGFVWGYNTQIYFEQIGEDPKRIGIALALVPLIGGSFGVLVGGLISDRVVKRVGPYARIIVLCVSLVVAAPFVAGALFFRPLLAYASLGIGYIFGEVWVGVTLTIVVELVPESLRSTTIAVYFFIITNIGGNAPLLLPPIRQAFVNRGYSMEDALRAALYIIYPGSYILAAVIFLFVLCILKRDINRARE